MTIRRRNLPAVALVASLVAAACARDVTAPMLRSEAGAALTVGSWVSLATMPVPRGAVGATASDGKIFAFGGQTRADCTYTDAARVYDPATDVWTLVWPMPTRRTVVNAAAVGGTVHAIGGGVGCGRFTGVNEVYTPATNQWRTDSPMPVNYGSAAVSHGGRIYVFGGSANGVAVNHVRQFDPATQLWTSKAPMPTARVHSAAVVLDGKVYVLAGCCTPTSARTLEVYDIASDSWTTRNAMPFMTHWANAAAVNGTIYMTGVTDDLQSVRKYDWQTDSWSADAPLPERLILQTLVAAGGTLYLLGGEVPGIEASGRTYAFTPQVPNAAPVAVPGADQRLECVAGSATASLDGSASFDSDGRIAAYSWSRLGNAFAATATATVVLPLGSHGIDLEVTDDQGATGRGSLAVQVVDTRAPDIQVARTSNRLWPANHAMVHVANLTASDACESAAGLLVTVTSNEAANGYGDGDAAPDWEVRASPDGSLAVWLRAERSGSGNGRVYTVTGSSSDGAGNASLVRATFEVAHDARGRR